MGSGDERPSLPSVARLVHGGPDGNAAGTVQSSVHGPEADYVSGFLGACLDLKPDVLRRVLDTAHHELGLGATVDLVLMPAMRQVGTWWAAGTCDVGQELLTTEAVRGWLARVTAHAPPPRHPQPILLACGPRDRHTLGLEALTALLAQQRCSSRLLGARTTRQTLLMATTATPVAAVVLVSHLSIHRQPAVEVLKALAETDRPLFYAGNAFGLPSARDAVPGIYLGENLQEAAGLLRKATAG